MCSHILVSENWSVDIRRVLGYNIEEAEKRHSGGTLMNSATDGIIEIHVSDVSTYKDCRQRWDFESPLRRNLTTKIPSKHLWLGSIIHYSLSAYYHPETPRELDVLLDTYHQVLIRDFLRLQPYYGSTIYQELEEFAELGAGMLEHYYLWASLHDKFDVLEPEVNLRVPLPVVGPHGERVDYVGSADALIESREGILLEEFKTAQTFPDIRGLYMEDQLPGYLWAAQLDPRYEGMRPVGMQYTFLRKKLPAIPKELKRGGVSQAKNIDTTLEVYEATLASLGEPTTLYGEILNILRAKGNTFFLRTTLKPPPSALTYFGTHLTNVAAEMISPLTPIYPSGNRFKCSWCGFKLPCLFTHFGLDPAPILEADYVPRSKRQTFTYGEEA